MQTIEIIVATRPADNRDRFPVTHDPERITTRIIQCADGNLSRVYKDAYLESEADVVIFKHDDFGFRNWDSFETQLWTLMDKGYYVLGFAGSRSYTPMRNVMWWAQAQENRQRIRNGYIDNVCRGMVSHPPSEDNKELFEYLPTFFGEPGPAVVLDGACIVVRRKDFAGRAMPDFAHPFNADDILASCFDKDFTYHFYDIAFTLNATLKFKELHHGPVCYAMIADVIHCSLGVAGEDYNVAGRKFKKKYMLPSPVTV